MYSVPRRAGCAELDDKKKKKKMRKYTNKYTKTNKVQNK